MTKKAEKYTIYVATNAVTGERYIGATKNSLGKRKSDHYGYAKYWGGRSPFHRAIIKYGIEVFVFSVLSHCETVEDAILAEVRAISEIKPEYNRTRGGDGNLGNELSNESRKKIADANRGNAHRKGKKHTEATKEIIRKTAVFYKDEWIKRSHLGPEAASRSVVCLDENIIFLSASAAARHYGVAKSSLIELCLGQRGRKTVGGHRFAYVETADATG